MPLSSSRWITVTPSSYEWERRGLDFIREGLPDHEPYRAWANFEFTAPDGRAYEVDLLVLTKVGFWLVELKGRPGIVSGDVSTWTWTEPDGRKLTLDNPYHLANRKAKALASLLRADPAIRKQGQLPFLEALIFLSDPGVESKLQGAAGAHVVLSDSPAGDPGAASNPRNGVLAALLHREIPGLGPPPNPPIGAPLARALVGALAKLGIRPSRKERRVGDYICGALLGEGPGYQDFAAEHASLPGVHVRVRRYLIARAATEDERRRLQRVAQREFRLLKAIDHPGILRADDYRDDEYGAAILLHHDPKAIRLDHFLVRESKRLTPDLRLGLLRQIAEAVRYAHSRGVIHRALGPGSILIFDADQPKPQVKLFNWQVAVRELSTDSPPLTSVESLVEQSTLIYMAPETIKGSTEATKAADIFSLGALAYLLFTDTPPARSHAERDEALREHHGLRVSAALDGAGQALDLLIHDSTQTDVDLRIPTAEEFLVCLDLVEEEMTAPERLPSADPLTARKGDLLEHGFKVERILGKGSTALALLVTREGMKGERVLKVALEEKDNDMLRGEADALREIRSEFVAGIEDVLEFRDRTALLLKKSGDETLATYLAKEGRLSLDLLERFGENLLEAVASLERHGILHRDIKPENIGVHSPRKQSLQLVLFDFSLARAPLDNLYLGTPLYRDPFLGRRKPPRWDPAADRYSAALTLYQMATGTLPRYGDGKSNADLTDAPLVLDPDQFDSAAREGLREFFEKALAKDLKDRFPEADDMLRAWRAIFQTSAVSVKGKETVSEPAGELLLDGVTPDTQVASLGLSTRAVNALDRLDVLTVRDLVRLSPSEIQFLRGVGSKTRAELREAIARTRAKFSDLESSPRRTLGESTSVAPATAPTQTGAVSDASVLSIEDLCARIHGPKPEKRGEKAWRIREALLGLSLPQQAERPGIWPTQADVARKLGVERAQVAVALGADRSRWLNKAPWMTVLREEVLDTLKAAGGVLTAKEIADLLLASHETTVEDVKNSGRALLLALGIARAAVEAEQGAAEPRFTFRRGAHASFVAIADPPAAAESLAAWANRLGEEADAIAGEDPLVSQLRAVGRLRSIEMPDIPRDCVLPSDDRILRLAAAASKNAVISTRGELYPRGMPAGRALRLARSAVAGLGLGDPGREGNEFSPVDVHERVRSRYPEAAQLPGRPELDSLLAELDLELDWVEERQRYRRNVLKPLDTVGSTVTAAADSTRSPVRAPDSPESIIVRDFEERLRAVREGGGFLIVRAKQREALRCEEKLVRRLEVTRLSCDRLLIDALRAVAESLGIGWDVVLEADRAGPGSPDWQQFLLLVARAVPQVEERVIRSEQPVLLVHLGLLRRYDQLDLLERLRDQAGRRGACRSVWVLEVPEDDQAQLSKDVPILSSGQCVSVPYEWIGSMSSGSRSEEDDQRLKTATA